MAQVGRLIRCVQMGRLHKGWSGIDTGNISMLQNKSFPKKQKKAQKDRRALCAPRSTRERGTRLADCVCVWTLPEPRCKSYGDKSPQDTQTLPFTTEGAYSWPACMLTLSSDDECGARSDNFSFSDEIDQSGNPDKSLGKCSWGWTATHCHALAATTQKGGENQKYSSSCRRSEILSPFPFFPCSFSYLTWTGKLRLRKQAWALGSRW